MYYNVTYSTAIPAGESKSGIKLTTHTPYLAIPASYEVPIVRIFKKIDRVITAPYCIVHMFRSSVCVLGWFATDYIKTLRRKQNGPNFQVDIFICILSNENV